MTVDITPAPLADGTICPVFQLGALTTIVYAELNNSGGFPNHVDTIGITIAPSEADTIIEGSTTHSTSG